MCLSSQSSKFSLALFSLQSFDTHLELVKKTCYIFNLGVVGYSRPRPSQTVMATLQTPMGCVSGSVVELEEGGSAPNGATTSTKPRLVSRPGQSQELL